MAATQRPTQSAASRSYDAAPEGSGWILFSGIMIAIVGTLNIIWGIAAIGTSSFFVANARYILSDLHTWGWIVLIIGAVQLVAAFSIWSGRSFGRWFGVAVASLNAIAALLSIGAYPFWALAIFSVDVLVIYGLVAYGGQARHALD